MTPNPFSARTLNFYAEGIGQINLAGGCVHGVSCYTRDRVGAAESFCVQFDRRWNGKQREVKRSPTLSETC